MELLHKRDFNYYDHKTKTVDMVRYIKTVMACNPLETIYSLCLDNPSEFRQALSEIEYLYSKELYCFVYPPKDYIKYKQGEEILKKIV